MREKIGNIKAVSDWLEKELISYGTDGKTIRNALLAAEELLLLYTDKLQSGDTDIKVEVIRGSRLLSLEISVLADEYSPETLESGAEHKTFDTIIRNSGFSTDYSYSGGINKTEIVIKRFFGFLQNISLSFRAIRDKRILLLAFFTHILSIAANLMIPIYTGRIIVAYTDNIMIQIIAMACVLLLLKLVYNVFFSITNILYSKVSFYSETELRKELIVRMFSIENGDYEELGTGTFIQRLTTDLKTISAGITTVLDLFSEGVYYIGVLIASAMLNFRVFLAELAAFAILLLIERRRAFRLEIDRRKTYLSDDSLSGSIIDCVNGISEIKLLNARGIFSDRISRNSDKSARNASNANRNSRMWIITGSCIVTFIACFIMIYLGHNLHRGIITVPTALILFNYFTIIDRPVILLIQRGIEFFESFNLATERVRNLYDGSEFRRESYGCRHIDRLYGDIVFDDVTFAYNHDDLSVPDNDIIKNASFNIKRGETVAFVGKSGSGKSTVLRLISRQVPCYSGSITIDGYDLYDIDCDSLYDSIGIISQSTVLFNCSIRDNLLLARPDATEEELRDACEKACILEDIENTENGFDTMLGERGVRFSGGQRQRLAVARALLRNTGILLLDEATSAMDNATQDRIMRALDSVGRDRTVLIVAHRLSTIKNADRIMLVGDKRILASGTHEELMRTSEEYRNLYRFENPETPAEE